MRSTVIGIGISERADAAHLLELALRCHLLDEQCRLNALEEARQPPYELALGDAELGIGRWVGVKGDREPIELVGQFG